MIARKVEEAMDYINFSLLSDKEFMIEMVQLSRNLLEYTYEEL